MDDAARLAGLLYHRLLRRGACKDADTEDLTQQLQQEILSLKNNRHIFGLLYYGCSNRLCLILWMLYCGGINATGSIRAWHTEHIRTVYVQYQMTWGRTKSILRKFAFDDRACEGPMKQLWNESLTERTFDIDVSLHNASTSGGCRGWEAFVLEHGGPAF